MFFDYVMWIKLLKNKSEYLLIVYGVLGIRDLLCVYYENKIDMIIFVIRFIIYSYYINKYVVK